MAEDEVTLPQAARLRGVNVRTLEAAARSGKLPARRFGERLWATTLAHVDVWLRDAKHRPGPRPQKAARQRQEGRDDG